MSKTTGGSYGDRVPIGVDHSVCACQPGKHHTAIYIIYCCPES